MSTSEPFAYEAILKDTQDSGFTMASEPLTGSLLRTLAATKPGGKFLELGTGTGLSTSWILAGMDAASTLISVDNDPKFLEIAERHLHSDERLTLVRADAGEWLEANAEESFDYIFADTWHGKYLLLDETLALLKPGGLYIIDDLLPQPNWPEGHDIKAHLLKERLLSEPQLWITQQDWATGIMIGVKK
ncbi:O-methyltransferase [Siphonobacter sp. SORGH_AS_1065]|uniref:O-methyltransferase n=1 Tax=Siphonobacter sp. SORGH_AS_1065 TaxID=3041795 RepID=UPI0027872170|nr:class I SAM-dependent methyltransferase [Siphonobacter sp. SORGH_AS_1065]MDQ1089375.1 putative O-methyltransferase YrrM [Siphonobacter sp. SORGH_AS_1065]